MPNYNSHSYIKETVKSINQQDYKNWELIIVDDNSNIKTKNILESFKKNNKIKIYFLKKNRGDGFCRIFGYKKSKSSFIAFIDSDDIWPKNKLKVQYNFMKKNNLNFTYTNYIPFKNSNLYLKTVQPPEKLNFESFIKNSSIATSSIMIKKKLLKNIKLCKSPNFEDYYLKCQIIKKVKYAYCIKKNLLKYRLKKKSLSKNKLRNIFWLWKINRKFNKLSFLTSLISLTFISYNSLKKYGIK
jgi:teichuronic acid biosynthesis glycosyltransferase TuaG